MNDEGGEQPELRSYVCFNFYRGWRAISEYYRHFLPQGVSAPQSYVLELCSETRGVDVRTLAGAMEIDSPAVSALLGRMESAGLIRREVLPTNRRHTLTYLTPKGSELRDEVRCKMQEADRELFRHVSRKDLEQLAGLVDKIQGAVHGIGQVRTRRPAWRGDVALAG
ncbi:MarR family winged helix-turn-helix transcriptional regulator [Aquabacterium sp. A7-Y]|uniref:MarR family winged helix-turn-helix transcriptional regulator n=1 Tax=Aquabacterium sp. A7-Y TaxID=1349605 RepID=UPI00223CFC36|nr:MarR family winged helix-turn-helix transcriptional regulator [Aquabacterium sp. A7-Y]MCW7536904.1 MarR family winged helix-turn-helix transcriptional regulator [Aquabacterium sp. A7-Y]